ncbi:MAG TPA: acyl-CoA dehydrogenase family protein [Solirubrobacteraceae bacterium]|nr:acyl-CoA dehydrogenase family protein [Solirubrobacteraceae bacterium]
MSSELGDYRESFVRFLAEEEFSFPRAAEHGFVAMAVGEEHGGAGVADRRFGFALIEEAMRAGQTALALALAEHNLVAVPLLLGRGDDERLATGELCLACAGLEQPLDARAQALQGSAAWVIGGEKAGRFLLAGRSAPEDADVSLYSVGADAPGLTVTPSEPPPGLEGCDLAGLQLAGVPAERLGGADLVAEAQIERWLALAVLALAGARTALETTVQYVGDRRAFGQPIARFQNTRVALARVACQLDAVGAFVERCVSEREAGGLTAPRAASAKLGASEAYGAAVDCGVQLHGGYGYMAEYAIARAYADARFLRLYGGRSEALAERLAASIGL